MSNSTAAPRHDIEIERAVLNTCLSNQAALFDAVERLTEQDFYHPPHQLIWEVIADNANNGPGTVDEHVVVDQLRNDETLTRVGGASYVASLTNELPAISAIGEHCRILREAHRSREILRLCREVLAEPDPTRQIERLEEGTTAVLEKNSRSGVKNMAMFAAEWKQDENSDVMLSGLPQLDSQALFRRGSLNIIAANPGVGKTALMFQIALETAKSRTVVMGSAEMTGMELFERAISMATGLPTTIVRRPHNEAARKQIEKARHRLRALTNLKIIEPGNLTPARIASVARVEKMKNHGLDMVIVDYIQLLNLPSSRSTPREQVVAEIVRQCKNMAQTLNVPVLAASQLSRAHLRAKRKPGLHDLRESGAIEAHADSVIILNRVVDGGLSEREETLVLIRKNRHGIPGKFRLRFCPGAKFSEYSTDSTSHLGDNK